MFTKVRQVRAFESIIEQVETVILSGELTVGDRLPPERELQGLLDVSRNTLRESLRVLEQKGLIEVRKGKRGGIFVKPLNADPMAENLRLFIQSQRIRMEKISEFRQDLEGLVARRAALEGDSRMMREVERWLQTAGELAQAGASQWDEFMQADREVHLALARLTGNPLHHYFLEIVHTQFHWYHIHSYLPRDEQTIQSTLKELQELVQAVSRNDAERAEILARDHVRRATEIMQRVSTGEGRGRQGAHRRATATKPSSAR
jgi:GntR family transcriptional regulator, transcriptional repressor for pyruvate dehydrogenase complex